MARVLLIEPHPVVRRLIELQLRRLGHEPVVLDEHWRRRAFDAAVIEPAAPEELALARELRRRRPGILLVFVSVRHPTAETAALEPVAHLVKPYDLERLAEALALLALHPRKSPLAAELSRMRPGDGRCDGEIR